MIVAVSPEVNPWFCAGSQVCASSPRGRDTGNAGRDTPMARCAWINVCDADCDDELAGWSRHGVLRGDRVEEGRGSIGQGAGESQCGVTCRTCNRK